MRIRLPLGPLPIWCLARIVNLLMRTLLATMKIEIDGLEKLVVPLAAGRPVVLITWHGNIFSVILARLSVQLPRLMTMVSLSKDGEITVKMAEQFGIDFARGSSGKGGGEAAAHLVRELGEKNPDGTGRLVIHFCDGPRGPRHQLKKGFAKVVRRAQAVVIPVQLYPNRRLRVRSWDRHQFPLPFCKMRVVGGEVLDFGGDAPAEESEESVLADLAVMQDALIAMTPAEAE